MRRAAAMDRALESIRLRSAICWGFMSTGVDAATLTGFFHRVSAEGFTPVSWFKTTR